MNDTSILDGIRVADFSQGMAGPYCGHLLAQYGADVVKVEPPGGDWLRSNGKRFGDHSAMSIMANRGKRSLALDLKCSAGQAAARKLIAAADLVLENNRPGVMGRLGLDYAAARAIKPDIVYLSVTGFGQTGPYRDRPGLDTVIQAYTGLTNANSGTNGIPHRVGVLVPDTVTGLYAFQSVLVALFAKSMGRGGRYLDVNLTQAMAAFQANMLIQTTLEGARPEVLAVPSGTYPTADGWISFAVINEGQWPRLATAIGRSDLISDERFRLRDARRSNYILLNEILAHETKRKPTAVWVSRLEAADVPHSKVNTYADLLEDRHLEAIRGVVWIDHTGVGRIPVAGIPAAPPADESGLLDAPAIGEHSREVLTTLGIDVAEIEALIAAGVVGCARKSLGVLAHT
jgi:crotonobetainyl-CoA:carnitine CoA-transferase CaiB-like acyl-CoA transferase